MARVPLINEQVVSNKLVLNVANVGLTEEQFSRLCGDNDNLFMELTAQKELIIMSPNGLNSSWRETILCTELTIWARKDGSGITYGSNAGYKLPNGAFRSPDASWVRRDRLAAFTKDELEKFGHLCPDFAAEVMSPSNTLSELKEKMTEYLANGAQLGWLIDPYEARVYVYRPGRPVECLEKPAAIGGEPILPGFVFNVSEIW